MDFVSDSLSGERRLKYLTVADDFSHESVDNRIRSHGHLDGISPGAFERAQA